MVRSRCGVFALAAALLGLQAGTAWGQALYGITSAGELITINTTTGAGTLVAPISPAFGANGLAFRGSRLYAWDPSASRLRELNPTTAAVVSTLDVGLTTTNGPGDLSFRGDGVGFLAATAGAGPELWRLDLTGPTAMPIAPLNPPMYGLAFHPAGVLYGLELNGGQLFTIDPVTGAATLIGATGLPAQPSGGIAFDAAGNLFAALGPAAGSASLYRLNPSTAAPTLIGTIGFTNVSGITFQPSATPPPPPTGQLLYGITWSNQLITINPATGAGALVGPLSSNMMAFGLGFRGTNLYTFDQAIDRLQQLNPATGATITTIDIGVGDLVREGDIVFRSDGVGFVVNGMPTQFFRFDVTPPSSALIGLTGQMFDGLAFNGTGVLYGLKESGDQLYTINPTTAATTLVGNTGLLPVNAGLGGIDFDNNGNLYAAVSFVGSPSFFYRIDPSTGLATLIGNIGFNDVSGIRFAGAVAPPPPPFPPPPPRGGGDEGSFPGSGGPRGSEGGFGFGGGRLGAAASRKELRTEAPVLWGPFHESPGLSRVFNVSHRQGIQAAAPSPQSISPLWSGLAGVLGAVTALAVRKKASSHNRQT